jgi:predicted transcriptional regulator
MSPMENPRTIAEILSQTKKIEENNWNSTQYLNSINMLLTSNDLGAVKDENLSEKFQQLNHKIEDINKLTEDLLSHLSSKHN